MKVLSRLRNAFQAGSTGGEWAYGLGSEVAREDVWEFLPYHLRGFLSRCHGLISAIYLLYYKYSLKT